MTWSLSATPTVRSKLARHLGRLQESLSAVAEQVRESAARAVGRTVAEAVGEAVYGALEPHDDQPRPLPSSPAGFSSRPQGSRQDWDDPWGQRAEDSHWPDPYARDEYDAGRYDDEPEADNTLSAGGRPHAGCYGRAVAAGLQAAAWWIRRRSGRVSLVAALAVGAVAGLAVLASHASGVAGLVASALGLGYLIELVRSAGTLLGRAGTP